jgi:trypanothione synthetase/amidase
MSDAPRHHRDSFVTPYGEVLGSFQGVPGYSNGHDHYYSREQHYHNGVYTGIGFQCVEYVRRWLQASKGLNFFNIPWASHAWKLKYVERLSDNAATSIRGVNNGSSTPPVAESLLIWESSPDAPVGHIAVITDVNVDGHYIRIAEQNKDNNYWPGDYARELRLDQEDGRFFIRDEHPIIGWMVINFDVDSQDPHELGLDRLVQRIIQPPVNTGRQFLDLEDPAQKLFASIWGAQPTREGEESISYYVFEAHFYDRILMATMELNHMCLRATDYVIASDELMTRFGLPEWIWPLIRRSWQGMWASGSKTFSGRFDLAFNGRQIKMFEYNSDSAGTYLEAGVVQVKWAEVVGCDVGKSASGELEAMLMSQAKALFEGQFVHMLIDNDNEEIYNALYLQTVFARVGVPSKVVIGLEFTRTAAGTFIDRDGQEIKAVWKMWNWETVISDYSKPREGEQVKISDILLAPDIQVYEPIWKLVTSNKALLAVLWELFPNHPNLLRTDWSLEKWPENTAYVQKPIVGRCGQNVQIFDSQGGKLEAAEGRYGSRDCIYQEVFPIQKFDNYNPVMGSWVVGRQAAGFGIREDLKLITDHESPYGCCRVVNY